MKQLGLGLGIALLAANGLWADEWSRHWSVSGKPELKISAGDAAVVIEAGSDNAIEAKLTTVGWSIGGSGIQVEERQYGNTVRIDVKVPSRNFSFGNRSIRLVVRAPRELLGEVHTGDGSIGLHGLRGVLRADTGDGSIHADQIDGDLEVHTGDGSVHAQGRFDKLRVQTSDGSVDVDASAGSKVDMGWRIQTGDGSVRVRVPRDLAADVEAHTGDGGIHFDSAVSVTSNGDRHEHDRQGKLNGGGATLVMRTGDGSINLDVH